MKPRVIALYLPQFHPFRENDEWWGPGFTEWRSVARATPLYSGHYQPHIPADLGFYDLRVPEVREQQALMAREAGIEGFCYWHYWFGNGKRLMERIFDEVLESGKPDFPFCLGWANHSWYAKNWNSADTKGKDRLLIEQTYPGVEDIRKHYEYVLKAFRDSRYIKYGNKPFFMIYEPRHIPSEFITMWNKWAIEDGFDGIYFVCNLPYGADEKSLLAAGFQAVVKNRVPEIQAQHNRSWLSRKIYRIKRDILRVPCEVFDYRKAIGIFVNQEEDALETHIPYLVPNFDHSPRSGRFGFVLDKATPALFGEFCRREFSIVKNKQNPFVILRSWNEWGEGNYMEPDLQNGHGYLSALHDAVSEL